jgi:hypothetical protein
MRVRFSSPTIAQKGPESQIERQESWKIPERGLNLFGSRFEWIDELEWIRKKAKGQQEKG